MIGYSLLIEYYRKAWNSIPEEFMPADIVTTKVSVIIALRNEAGNMKTLLQSLLAQDYPAGLWEIVLIDDHSDDDTWKMILQASEEYALIKAIRQNNSNERSQAHKKIALTQGIEASSGDLIVTTDADCIFPPQWLSSLVTCYELKGAQFIAAPVAINIESGFLAVFENLDFLTLQGITGAAVHKKFHCMCNGANLAYTKKAFYEVKGFEGIDTIPSGDDMLLMFKIFVKYPDRVFYMKNRQAIVSTQPVRSWKAFFNQRIRWASKATYYQDKKISAVLVLVYLVNLCFLVSAIASFWKTNYFAFFSLMLIAKVLIEFPFVNSVAKFFGQQRLMKYFPLLQPLHIMYVIVSGWLGKFGSYEWKGRSIKT
jgi:cellulose synthase/poly-beta-1,6-N-acetylglucosamine synthase-like glycosyltransferase